MAARPTPAVWPYLVAWSRVAREVLGTPYPRAWALRGLAGWVDELAASSLRAAAEEQEAAVLPHLTRGSFLATHWLVSFALLAQGELEAG